MQSMSSTSKSAPPNMDFDKLLTSWKTDYIASIESSRDVIQTVFQTTLNSGYKNMFIAAGIIALIGLVAATMLSNNKAYEKA